MSSKIGAVKKKQKYIFFYKKQKSGRMEPSPMYLGRPPCGQIFDFAEKKCTFVFFNGYSTGLLLNSDSDYQYIFPNSPKFGTFLAPNNLYTTYYTYEKYYWAIFLSKTFFFGKKLIFGAKNWFLGLKLIFLGEKCCWWIFLHKFNHFYT